MQYFYKHSCNLISTNKKLSTFIVYTIISIKMKPIKITPLFSLYLIRGNGYDKMKTINKLIKNIP